jgi:hypothetical protein
MAQRGASKPTVLGGREYVKVRSRRGQKWSRFKAKMDTGAKWSRIGAQKAARMKLGPVLDVRTINTSNGGSERRVVVPATVRISGRRIKVLFTISTRKPGLLIGRRTINGRFDVRSWKRYLTTP